MTDYAFYEVAITDQSGGAVRLAPNARITVTDPATGLTAAGLTQNGQPVPYVTTDGKGAAAFTSTLGSVQITSPGGLSRVLTSPDYVSDQAAAAKSSADAAAASATTAAAPTDGAVANVVNTAGSQTQTAMDARYKAPIASKGTDLVTNGTGLLRDATNFSTSFTFNGADAPTGASGSFVPKTGAAQSASTDESMPFDPAKPYRLSFQARQTVAGAVSKLYGAIVPYDVGGNAIGPANYMFISGTQTTLAADLKPGDTTIKLASAANWYGSGAKPAGSAYYFRSIQFWDYTDVAGKTWAPYTYTRHTLASDVYADGGVDTATNTITLRAAYAGTLVPAGTAVSQPSAGGSYLYMPSALNVVVPETWTTYADTFDAGVFPPASQAVPGTGAATWSTGVPPATAQVRVGWLLNYAPTSGRHAIAAVSFSDAAAANAAVATKLSIADAVATYAPKVDLVGSLPAKSYIAHRAGAARFGEYSMAGYDSAAADGFSLEADVRVLSDGVLVMNHDATVDRTMTGTGNVSAKTSTDWAALRVKPSMRGGARFPSVTWEQVLERFGGRHVLVPEVKDPAALNPLIDSITSRGLHRAVILQSFTRSDVDAAVAAGICSMWLSDTVTDFVSVKSAGIEWLGVSSTVANRATYIANAVAAGLKVSVWTIDDAATANAVFAEGASSVFSDDPWWVSGKFDARDGDPYAELVAWPHALSVSDDAGFGLLTLRGSREFGKMQAAGSGTVTSLQSWAGVRASGNVEITATLRFAGPAAAEDRWAGIAFGVWPDESSYIDGASPGQSGYHALIRRNMQMGLYRFAPNVGATSLGSYTTGATPLAVGAEGTVRVRLRITATDVSFTNLNTGATITVADTTYRNPGRLALTLNGADCFVSNVSVVDL